MKRLSDFAYFEPSSLADAVATLASASGDARVLAGGTDLLVDIKIGRLEPKTVVNLKRIPDLAGIWSSDGGIRIGALTKVTVIAESELVGSRHPALRTAASLLAPPPVRALATIGGNVGRASPASDLGPALIVSGGVATIAGVNGTREELVEDLYTGPGTTSLAVSDIITSFFLPDPPPGFGSAHVKLGKRGSGTDIAMAGAAAGVVVAERTVSDCRIALASLGPIPMRARPAEQMLVGSQPTEENLTRVAARAGELAEPIGDVRATAAYRTTLARVLTLRALRAAVHSADPEAAA